MIGLLQKLKLRGLRKVGWWFTFVGAAYNLVRRRRLRTEATAGTGIQKTPSEGSLRSQEHFPIPPNPLLAAILTSSQPERETKIIVQPDFQQPARCYRNKKYRLLWSEMLLTSLGRLGRILLFIVLTATFLRAQVVVRSQPPAVLLESSGSLSLTAHVLGTLPGESTAVLWSVNDEPLAATPQISFSPANGPAGVPIILKATSVFDPSKFVAVPVISLQKSEVAQISFPEAMAYHPSTARIYVAGLVARGNTVDTSIIEIAPDGRQSTLATLSADVIDKLLPYPSTTGTPYLLAVGFASGSVYALNLGSRTARRVVTGLSAPVSASLHPSSGDLYIAEQNARRISVVSRFTLDSAVAGTSTASFLPLPVTIPQISGVAFLLEGDFTTISLLASTTSGALYKVKLEDNTFSVIATGLLTSQEILVLQNSHLGFPFILTASSTNLDGQGRISALSQFGTDPSFGPAYAMASGLDVPTDLAFAPEGNPYSPTGRSAIFVTNSSPTPGRGKLIRWEIDPASKILLYALYDRVQPSLSLTSPSEGQILSPGAPVEIRWTYTDADPMNPPYAPFPGLIQISVSTDGGNSFSPAGPGYFPSGPEGKEYSQVWQVPVNLAGLALRLRVETRGLEGKTLTATRASDFNVIPTDHAIPMPLFWEPNFIVAGGTVTASVYGLNFRAGANVAMGEGITVSSPTVSSSRLGVDLSAAALSAGGPQSTVVCNDPESCRRLDGAFFVLPPDGPRIAVLEPSSGSPGATVVITGNNFSGIAANNRVTFGNAVATISRAEATRLVVQVPFGVNQRKSSVTVQTNGISSNTADFFLVPPGLSFPSVNRNGIVNGANFSPGSALLAAGSIASIFGTNMVPNIAAAAVVPLPPELLNTTAVLGGIAAPLFFAAPNQINAQLPEELAGLGSVPVTIVSRGIAGNSELLNLAAQSPGVFSADGSGRGLGAILNQNGSRNSPTNPERISNTLQVYMTGLGISTPPVPTGQAAPEEPLSRSVNPPVARIDGILATVTFSGRSPGLVGVDQVNIVIPAGVSTGRPIPLVITAGGIFSNTFSVNVIP